MMKNIGKRVLNLLLVVFTTFFAACTFTTPQGDDGVSIVVYDEAVNPVDHRLFGQFMERAGSEPGPESALVEGTKNIQPKVLDLLDAMDIPIIRFPGGGAREGSENHWPDFVDNVPGREVEREAGKYYGYHEFLVTCEEIGAEPLLVTNFRDAVWKSIPLEEAAMRAAGLVAYANAPVGSKLPEGMPDWPAVRAANGHPEPFNVKIFQIGNEWPAWSHAIDQVGGIEGLRNQVNWTLHCVKTFADAMREIDPDIQLIIDGQVWEEEDARFMNILLAKESLRDYADYVAVHFYRPWDARNVLRDGNRVKWKYLENEAIWNAMMSVPDIDAEGRSILRSPGWDLALKHDWPVVVTEWNWNGWGSSNGILNSRYARGVGAAGFLHAMIRNGDRIDLACQSMLVGSQWGIMAIMVDPTGEHEPVMNPTGQMTAFYSRYHGGERLRVESSGMDYFKQPYTLGQILSAEKVGMLDIVATASKERVFLHVIHRGFSEDETIRVRLKSMKISGPVTRHTMRGKLDADKWEPTAAEIVNDTFKSGSRSFEAKLEARTVTIFEIPVSR